MLLVRLTILSLLFSSLTFAADWKIISGRYATVEFTAGHETTGDSLLKIAELAIPRISKMIGLDVSVVEAKKTRIIFTDAPDVSNGFAIENVVTIYGTSSMYIPFWTGNTTWYQQVLTHELVHHLTFRMMQRKLDFFGALSAMSVPRWFFEGTAQYYSETWNMYRGDIYMKNAILNGQFSYNSFNSSDGRLLYANAHAFVRYLATTYGDSSLIKLMSYNKDGWMYDFDEAFRATYTQSIAEMFPAYNRHLILYYGDRFADYPVTKAFKKEPVFGNFSDQFIQLTNDSLFLVSSLQDAIYQFKTAFLTQKKNGKFETKEIITNNFSTSLLVSPDKRYIAYGRPYIEEKEDQPGQTTQWTIYDRQDKKYISLTKNIRAINGVFSSDNQLVLVEVKSDHTEINRYSFTGEKFNLLTTKMPIGTLSTYNDVYFFDAQSNNGNRDLFQLNNDLSLTQLTNDVLDDRTPIKVNDSTLIFNRYINENPTIASLNLLSKEITVLSDDQFEYFINSYHAENKTIQLTGWSPKRLPQLYSISLDTLLALRSQPSQLTKNIQYADWTKKEPDAGNVIYLPDTTLENITRKDLFLPQMNMINLMTFALPNYDYQSGAYGLGFLSAFLDPLNRQIFTLGGFLDISSVNHSVLSMLHTLTVSNIHFSTLYYHGPSILSFQGNRYLELITNRVSSNLTKVFYPDNNQRMNLTTSLGYTYNLNQLATPDSSVKNTTYYHGLQLGTTFIYSLPTKYSSFLPKRQLMLGVTYFHALSNPYNPKVLDLSASVATNLYLERLGLSSSFSFMNTSGKLFPYQLLGIDRFYEIGLPRDYNFSKTIRGLKEDISGTQLIWSSTEIQFLLAEQTGLKLLFLPLENITISGFYDLASVAKAVSSLPNSLTSPIYSNKNVHSFGFELSSNTIGLMKLSLGHANVTYSNNQKDKVTYGRISLSIPGL